MNNKPIGFIYKTTNIINGKIYIGQHKYTYIDKYDKYYLGAGKLLKEEIKKLGSKNFTREILKECFNQDELDYNEKYYIKLYNSTDENIGYNILYGGFGGHNGEFSKETKIKIGEASKLRTKEKHPRYGKHLSDEHKKRISQSMKGRKLSKEHKAKLSKSLTGIKRSEETRKKIAENNRKRAIKNKENNNEHKSN